MQGKKGADFSVAKAIYTNNKARNNVISADISAGLDPLHIPRFYIIKIKLLELVNRCFTYSSRISNFII